jgi:hypothetical protein
VTWLPRSSTPAKFDQTYKYLSHTETSAWTACRPTALGHRPNWLRRRPEALLTPADSYRITLVRFCSQAIDTGTARPSFTCLQTLAATFYALIPGSKRANQYGPGQFSPQNYYLQTRRIDDTVMVGTGFWSACHASYSVKQIELSF